MVSIRPAARAARKIRRPVHPWNTVQHPWCITPFLIAPVLPGETLRNAAFQARAVSAPIKNDLLGWWLEHYVFYVKLRDLDIRDDILPMFTNPDFTVPVSAQGAANTWTYHNGRSRIDWVNQCLNRVTAEYFRDEDEAVTAGTYSGLPLAKANTQSVFDSIISEGDYKEYDVALDGNLDGTITAAEADEAMRQWELLRSMGLTEATYEDFLRSHGIQGRAVSTDIDPHRPELIRYEKSWTYPANTVEVGGIRSVASWSQNFRADKDRFFAEPGFIFGVTVARPKIYLGNQSSVAAQVMDQVQAWLPAQLRHDAMSAMIHVADDMGPLNAGPTGYFLDIRDLLTKGDQFVNHANDHNAVSLPSATNFDKSYVTAADITGLFATSATPLETQIRQDGVATFMIASPEAKDLTATTGASTIVV